MKKVLIKAGLALVSGLMLVSLAGCSSNAGGATTCGDYLNMSSSKQTDAVTKMLKDHGDSTANGAVLLSKASVWAYCNTLGSNSSRIDSVYTG